MKKHFFLFFIVINVLSIPIVICCPCEFSPEDQRPFFEQYEDTPVVPQEEEEE